MAKKVKLIVQGLTSSQVQSGAYALILAEAEGPYRIPIIVGTAEAQSIAIALERLVPPRPLTHDLFVSFTHSFGILLQEVFIYKFEDGVFYSEMVLFDGERQVRIDSRTSDAIAVALRLKAPVFTTDEIVRECGLILEEPNATEEEDEEDDIASADMPFAYDSDLTPADFQDKASLDDWLANLSETLLKEKLADAIEDEQYEFAKIYKDELKRREGTNTE
ncbi:hypothetical protein B5F77_10610 [Parabacteroides sp. An277]|uniref:bifunctional nuclease family protein n=1 Tax=Parabacteroides sp. An277 TaxID=1965619 RepID=UPI000B3B0214|nr:bifunctional nuclease family protein [Parabacteroides sp. An277]OUO51333.1 hypothetical protein B5F77_10610 [Parabacteroides sp. An277]